MRLRWRRARRVVLASLAVAAAACGSQTAPASHPATTRPKIAYANIGGYLLSYECAGAGSPTVILEAGYTASGISTYGPVIFPALARRTRVCTYDRAGDGRSDARPASVRPLTGATQARELHTLLQVIHAGPPYVLVGHSYGGMITRELAALYPRQVAGMVLLDASSEPEVAVYDRLHAGPWIDGTVHPAPNQKINIHATVRQLETAPSLGRMPLIVITAGRLQDQWLKPSRNWRPEPRPGSPPCQPTRSTSWTAASATSSRRWTRTSSSPPPRPCWPPPPSGIPSPRARRSSGRSRPPNACTAGNWVSSGLNATSHQPPRAEAPRPHRPRARLRTGPLTDPLRSAPSAPPCRP